eukprot:4176188-Karenia_brevis.AAC.1
MTCAPLSVAVRDGIHRLEEQREAEEARNEELMAAAHAECPRSCSGAGTPIAYNKRWPLTKLEDEARRRLRRQATAANQAIAKGNCLMVMQMLTGREVL